MYLGTIVNNADSSGKGLYVSASGAFRLFGDSNNYLTVDGGNLVLKSEELHIAASTFDVNTAGGGSLALGSTLNSNISGTNKGLYMSGSGDFLLYGSAQNYLKFDSAAASLDILSDSFALSSSTLSVDSTGDGGTGVIRLGASGGPSSATANTAGIYMDGGGALNVYGDAANYLRFDGSSVDIKSDEITIQTAGANKLKLFANGTDTPTFAMGATLNTDYDGGNAGVYMDGSGKFAVYGDASNYIRFNGSTVDIKSDELTIQTAGTNKLKLFSDGASTPTFAMGATLNTSVAGTNAGVYMDGTGDFLAYGNETNYSKFDVGGSQVLDIKASTFDLNTTNLQIENSTPKIRIGPASGGSRIELDGSTAELTFYSGSGANEVLKLDEKNSYTYYDPSTASSITNTGPEVRLQNGGSIISIGSHATNLSLEQIMGFNDKQAFFSGGRNGSLINVRNDFNSGYVRGIYSSATDRGTVGTPSTTAVIGINSDGYTSTSGVHSYGISAVGKNSNSGNSAGDVTGGDFQAVVHTSQTNDDIFGVRGTVTDVGISGYTSRGSAVKGVGGKYAIHGAGAGTYQGYFEGAVAATGNITAFASSDKRLKKNIIKIENPIDKIKKLNGIFFEWKEGYDEKVQNKINIGVIAQEVQRVLPEIVKERDDGYLAIKYEQLIPVLIEGMKEQQKQIDELKQKLEEL